MRKVTIPIVLVFLLKEGNLLGITKHYNINRPKNTKDIQYPYRDQEILTDIGLGILYSFSGGVRIIIGITLLILSLATWPFYLNFHLVLGILTVLYSMGIFNEWLRHGKKEKNDLYILTDGLLFVLASFQFVEYFY